MLGRAYSAPVLKALYLLMTTHISSLVQWIDTEVENRDTNFLDNWFSSLNSVSGTLDKLAIDLAKSFLKGCSSYDQVNGLLNQIMPIAGFEKAPRVFWQFYIAFEDFEHLDNPRSDAMLRIEKELRELNEI